MRRKTPSGFGSTMLSESGSCRLYPGAAASLSGPPRLPLVWGISQAELPLPNDLPTAEFVLTAKWLLRALLVTREQTLGTERTPPLRGSPLGWAGCRMSLRSSSAACGGSCGSVHR